jgi:hypothetical protein
MGWKDVVGDLRAKAEAELARRAFEAAVEKAGGEVLDDLETALLGKPGAADELLKKDAGEADPLEAARKRYGVGEAAAARPTREQEAADREARARIELAELKKKLGKG